MDFGEQLALAAAFVWSVAVILIRLSGLVIAPLPLTLFKTVVAVLCFALTLPFIDVPLLPELSPTAWGRLVISALLGISIADTMVVAALKKLGAGLHAIADCVYAPCMAFVGFMMFHESLNAWEVLGGLFVLAGVGVGMRLTEEVTDVKSLLAGVLLAGGAHLIMAVGILMVRDIYSSHSVVWVSGFRFFIASLFLVAYGLGSKNRDQLWEGFRRRDIWKWSIPMSILGPYLATMLWASGFVYTKAGRAAVFNQLSTVFVMLLAWLFLKEKLTARKLVGIALAVTGSVIVGTHH